MFYFAGLVLFAAGGVYLWFCFERSGYPRRLGPADFSELLLLVTGLCAAALMCMFARRKTRPVEHPLTASNAYRYLYYLSPFIGAAAGAVAVFGIDARDGLMIIAVGSVSTAATIWLVIDPALTVLELLGPNSIRLRRARARISKARKQRNKRRKLQLIEEARMQSTSVQADWQQELEPYANELAALVTDTSRSEAHRRARAIDIALHASKMGGRRCMQHLYHMARKACREKTQDDWIAHNISVWWDGVGGWRNERPIQSH